MTRQKMSYRDHAGALMRLGLPLIGSHVAQFAITMTDTVMLGWYDVTALAAQVLAGGVFFVAFITVSGFAWAVTPIVAEAEARGDTTQARRATRMSLWLVCLFGALVLPVLLFSGPVLRATGQTEPVAELAQSYLRIAGWGLFPALVVMVFKSYLSAMEQTRIVLWVTLAAAVINGLLNYLLIFGHLGLPEMGIRGAALASALTQLASAAIMVRYINQKMPDHEMFVRMWRADWEAFRRIFALGLPIGLTTLSEVALFTASSVMMGWLGELTLAAHGIALQITSFVFMIHIGLSNAATIRAGRANGARDWAGLRDGALTALMMAGLVVVLTVILFTGLPRPLIGLFLDPSEPARDMVIAIGIPLLAAAALFQLADAAQVMAVGLLRGVQDTRVPMIIAVVSYWGVGVPVAYGLGFGLGWEGVGIWLGLAAGLALAAALMMLWFWGRVFPALRVRDSVTA
ncbi:MATE family efflux transporter [Pseudooceanicola sp. C21-150M6]|uniref:MATE family efflux transporter n=1 Tax=Pseudooceanicola sp. C21-150M6 TaxID=3434355 RepID=UPI003D7F4E04